MYILLERVNDKYRILDTEDNSRDIYTADELRSLYINYEDTVIYGLSYLNLTAGVAINTVMRLYDADNIAHDFDGYTLTDACNDYDTLRYQILDVYNEPEVMNDIGLFELMFAFLRSVNKNLYDERLLQSTNYKYSVFSSGADFYIIKDKDGETYKCDAFTAPYVYFVEGKAIQGLTLTTDCTYVNDFIYSIKSEYMKYFSCTRSNQFKPVAGYVTRDKDSVVSDARSIMKDFGGYDSFNVGYHFPIVNVFKYTRALPDQKCLDYRYQLTRETIVDVGKTKITAASGVVYDNLMVVAETYKALNFCNESLGEKLLENLSVYETKCKIFNRQFDLANLLRQTKKFCNGQCYQVDGYKVNSRQTRDFTFVTPVGSIVITTENNVNDKVYGNIFTTRITNTGSAYFNFMAQKVQLMTGEESNRYDSLYNEDLDDCLKYADRECISYFDNNIYPLCFSDITYEEGDILINVACLVCGAGKKTHHSMSIFKVPLIFTGCRNERYSDGWIFRTLFQTMYMPLEVVENLYGYVDSSTLVGYYSTSRKPERKIMESVLGCADRYLSKLYEN